MMISLSCKILFRKNYSEVTVLSVKWCSIGIVLLETADTFSIWMRTQNQKQKHHKGEQTVTRISTWEINGQQQSAQLKQLTQTFILFYVQSEKCFNCEQISDISSVSDDPFQILPLLFAYLCNKFLWMWKYSFSKFSSLPKPTPTTFLHSKCQNTFLFW